MASSLSLQCKQLTPSHSRQTSSATQLRERTPSHCRSQHCAPRTFATRSLSAWHAAVSDAKQHATWQRHGFPRRPPIEKRMGLLEPWTSSRLVIPSISFPCFPKGMNQHQLTANCKSSSLSPCHPWTLSSAQLSQLCGLSAGPSDPWPQRISPKGYVGYVFVQKRISFAIQARFRLLPSRV